MTNEQKSQPEVERSSHTVETTESWGTQRRQGAEPAKSTVEELKGNPTEMQGATHHPDAAQEVEHPIQEPDPAQHRAEENAE